MHPTREARSIFIMKNVKLIHGDCLEKMKDIPDGSIDMVMADPPYGISYQSGRRADKNQWKDKISNDEKPYVLWLNHAYKLLQVSGRLICFTRWDVEHVFRTRIREEKFNIKSQVIWDKIAHSMGDLKCAFASRHEGIIYATKGKYVFKRKRPVSVLKYMRVSPAKLNHPNQKPLKLIEYLIETLTDEGDTVLDPFMGSGTTGVACVNLNRKFIGIELDEFYFDDAAIRIDPNYKKPEDKKVDDYLDKFFGD